MSSKKLTSASAIVVLKDDVKKVKQDAAKATTSTLMGKKFADLKAAEKDVLLLAVLSMLDTVDGSGVVK
jgi:hypothetical protein